MKTTVDVVGKHIRPATDLDRKVCKEILEDINKRVSLCTKSKHKKPIKVKNGYTGKNMIYCKQCGLKITEEKE